MSVDIVLDERPMLTNHPCDDSKRSKRRILCVSLHPLRVEQAVLLLELANFVKFGEDGAVEDVRRGFGYLEGRS
jgi:hypothetical protein